MNYCKHHFIHCIHILFKELTEIVAADLLNVMCWYTLCNIFKIIVFHYSVIFHSNGLKYSGLLLLGMINSWGCFNLCFQFYGKLKYLTLFWCQWKRIVLELNINIGKISKAWNSNLEIAINIFPLVIVLKCTILKQRKIASNYCC